MFELLSANTVTAMLPELTYSLPYFGTVDFRMAVASIVVFIVLTFFFWLLRIVILQRAKMLANKTAGTFDDVVVDAVQNVRAWVYTIVALYASLQFFTLPDLLDKIVMGVFLF